MVQPCCCMVFLMTEYKTVEKECSAEFTEKRSRFIGYVKPVSSQQEAQAFIARIKSENWGATHNVPAFVLRENGIQRCSDDGEPSGTAGVPVLDVILKSGITDVCVVVTRYFGGILLGAGGLVRAYSHASKLALESGGIITMAMCSVLCAEVDYPFYERMRLLLEEAGANIEDSVFADKVRILFTIRSDGEMPLSQKLTEVSNGRYRLEKVGEKFAKI